DAGHRETDAVPPFAMPFELPPAGGGEAVVLGAPAVFGIAPFGLQLAVPLPPVERRKQGSRIDLEVGAAEGLKPLRDPIPVDRLTGEDREDHQVERTLRDVELVVSAHGAYLGSLDKGSQALDGAFRDWVARGPASSCRAQSAPAHRTGRHDFAGVFFPTHSGLVTGALRRAQLAAPRSFWGG